MRMIIFILFGIFICHEVVYSQTTQKIFLSEYATSDDDPCLYVFPAQGVKTGAAVIICPGGGYQMLALQHEGFDVANWFAQKGVTAFVLKYSLGKFDGSGFKHPKMLNEAKQAMRIARFNANQFGVNQNLIGIMGFSAGGHLASTVCTHFDNGNKLSSNPVDTVSSLPNFCILGYPVINMDGDHTHWGSRRFLLGPTPSMEDIEYVSSEKHVSVATPPTFIFSTSDDASVPIQNSVSYYLALRQKGIPAELHIFEHGAHGKGLLNDDFALKQWADLLENWLQRWNVFGK